MMRSARTRTAAVAALVLGAAILAGPPASAHHSFAMFDNQKNVTLKGTVKEFQWTNPHSWIQIVVVQDGKPVEYSVEGSSPNNLIRRGWTRTSLKAGDEVTLVIHPLKNGEKGGSFVQVILPNGTILS